MFRQAIATSSRALRAAPKVAVPRPFIQSQFQAAPAFALRSVQPAVSRWYSDAKETEAKPAEEAKTEEKPAEAEKESDPLAELKKELAAKENEVKDWKDKCMRTVADFRNLQERTTREVKSAKDFAIQKFAKDLVDSVDNLDRALGMVPKDKLNAPDRPEGLEDLANLYEGLKMTEDILMNTLKKHGLERLNPEGEKFNPNEQEATFMTPQPDKEDGTVFFVQQKGFKLNGRVLRAAKVGVVKNK
ncbi:probable heat shock protein MGE1 precursor [Fusarium fujikuroi]|uniref:GrpE protein homolog n=4 Tax=Fusarium fujikuroi species complex TaxID=171627 RepID=A0A8H6CTR5_9HYPO|nr:putative heat shock protein MGE1 precursor [Fusarium proliferatum ET1]KAF5691754.1 molecular chaperone [Fusarium globosum]KAG4265446.1 molecular chaperone GrpE [Fusarium proliferatum]KLP05383.1 putative heat shock protein MGE1 precursor [Fusarium fujikuroi]KAG4286729.1 molecular chaperone GrpE [Fusarium proliferatum]KAG4294141.1 molecular chaperone GrpE [Fusarium proliferatum]